MTRPALLHASYALAHAPDLIRYGSKPTRELRRDPALLVRLSASLRSWSDALAYPPHQTFIGNLTPDALAAAPRPWTAHPVDGAQPVGALGRMVDESALYGLMKLSDDFDLLVLSDDAARAARGALDDIPGLGNRLEKIVGVTDAELDRSM